MKRFILLLLIHIYLFATIAHGDYEVPLIGFGHGGGSIGVVIRSDSFNISILLDGKDTTYYTPHEIEIPNPGNHTITLRKNDLKCCEKEICFSPPYYRYIDFYLNNCNLMRCDYNPS